MPSSRNCGNGYPAMKQNEISSRESAESEQDKRCPNDRDFIKVFDFGVYNRRHVDIFLRWLIKEKIDVSFLSNGFSPEQKYDYLILKVCCRS